MKVSKQARRDAKSLFRACMESGQLKEERVKQTVQSVIAGKPRGYMGILNHFLHLVKIDQRSRTARVESASSLDNATQQSIQKHLAARYGTTLAVQFDVRPELIGGLRVQVGSDVYDGSIRSRLRRLEETFTA